MLSSPSYVVTCCLAIYRPNCPLPDYVPRACARYSELQRGEGAGDPLLLQMSKHTELRLTSLSGERRP